MSKYDELMQKALNKEKLTEKEWEDLLYYGRKVDVSYSKCPNRYFKNVDVIIKWQDCYVKINYEVDNTIYEKASFYESKAKLVKRGTKMVEVETWVEV